MNVLFLCSRNRLRSPTAEAVFSGLPGIEVASAGTSPDADYPVSADLVAWADLIFAMEAVHKRKLTANFRPLLRNKRIVVSASPTTTPSWIRPSSPSSSKRSHPTFTALE